MADLTYEDLRALADEVERDVYLEDGQVVGRPGAFGQRLGFPGTDRPKTDDERLRDARQAAFLERLGKLSTPQQLMDANATNLGERLGQYNLNQNSLRDTLNSDFEHVGVLGPGSALHTFGTWMSALPAAAYATAEMVGQPVGDAVERAMSPAGTKFAPIGTAWRNKTPGRDLERAINTLAAPLTATVIADEDFQPDESYWAMQRDARKQAAGQDWRTLAGIDERAAARVPELASMPLQGDQYYERWGAPRPVAMAAGLVSDTLLDPFSATVPAVRVARSAKYFPAAQRSAQVWKGRKMLGGDYVIGGSLTGYGALDELLRRDQ